ncbi:SabA family sialic acid-binding adhesin, partial [Helicobacter pylori]
FKGNPKEGLPVLSNTNTTMEVKIITKSNNDQNTNETKNVTNETKNVTNDAHNLLTQAQTIMNVLTQNCPWVNNREGELGGA